MNPYDKTVKKITNLCIETITGKKPDLSDPVVFAQYNQLKDKIVDILLDFECEVRKPTPL